MRCPICHRRLESLAACPIHAATDPSPAGEETPEVPEIEGHKIGRLLGRGGFAWVFAARRLNDGADVALKVARGPFHARFDREAKALNRLAAAIGPALLGSGETSKGLPYLALELLQGTSWAVWLSSLPGQGIPPVQRALDSFESLCRTAGRLHQAQLVHRDLKPENIFELRDGQLRVLDFGLARFASELASEAAPEPELTRAEQRLGTFHYMAPEQCLDAREVTTATDIYSLGVILFELITGRPPFAGDRSAIQQAHVSRRPPAPSSIAPVSSALEQIVLRCLAKAPDDRFHSAADLLASIIKARRRPEAHPATEGPQAQPVPALERRAAAVLWAKTLAPITELLPSIQAEGGVFSSVLTDQYLFCFLEKTSPEQGVRAAIRAVQSLSSRCSPTDLFIVDVAPVRFHASHLGAIASLVRSETSASSSEMGSFLTPRAAQLLDSQQTDNLGTELVPVQQLTAVPLPEDESFNFHGRTYLLQELEREAQEAWSRHIPTLTAVIGEPGCGKTRILRELSTRLAQVPGVQLLRIEASADPEQTATLRSLLRGCLGLPHPGLTAAEVRKKCEPWMAASERKEELWRAVAVTLGVSPEADLDTAQRPSIPGEKRRLVAKAITMALQDRSKLGPVAVLLDDAHLADPSTLDALEIATLGEGHLPLWILATALPVLDSLRPFLGDRSGARFRHSLGPLEPASARALLLELLQPVDFVPESVLAHLEQSAQGVPRLLVELVHALRMSGAIRAQPGKTAWYIAADELLHSSATPLYQRLAKRILFSLSTPLQALAGLCAVMGKDVDLEEVRGVQLLLATTTGVHGIDSGLDPGIGLERLARAGMIKQVEGNKFEFCHPQLQQAVESLTSPTVRLQLHHVIYQFHASPSSGKASLPKLARHAAACGERVQAFDAYFRLAELARREHRYVEADQFYTAAHGHLGEADEEPKCRVLTGRGKVRYRMQRFSDALSDLVSARQIAERRGNLPQRLDLLLEEATVLDWLGEYQRSSTLTDAAVVLANQVDDPVLAARCELARGRHYFRINEQSQAERALARAASQAKVLQDEECLTIALLLRGLALACLDRPDESEEDFKEVIKLTESRGDHFHLGTAYINRFFLWAKRGSIDCAVADLQRAIHVSRELGYVQIERTASYNLAECFHWMGRDDEALPLALRADELMRRFFSDHPRPDALLVVRILATQGNLDEAKEKLSRLESSPSVDRFSANLRVLHRLAKLLVHRPAAADEARQRDALGAWSQLIEDARASCTHDEVMEVLWHAARVALRFNRSSEAVSWLWELQGGLTSSPLWKAPLDALFKLCPPELHV